MTTYLVQRAYYPNILQWIYRLLAVDKKKIRNDVAATNKATVNVPGPTMNGLLKCPNITLQCSLISAKNNQILLKAIWNVFWQVKQILCQCRNLTLHFSWKINVMTTWILKTIPETDVMSSNNGFHIVKSTFSHALKEARAYSKETATVVRGVL